MPRDASDHRAVATRGSEAVDASTFGLESIWRAVEGSAAEPLPDPLLGRDLGGVRLVRLIAEGGMGRVYEGRQESPTRAVAVKVVRPGFFTANLLRRFALEAEILGRLRHPWISQIFSAGTFAFAGVELPYFVMELIPDALTITAYASTAGLPLRERLELFCKVCEAVAYGHRQGVVHRDLKPNNILVDPSGHPKVIDFGVARGSYGNESLTALTDVGQMLGTVQYMSPEQLSQGSAEVDARSDVYALGVILYELLVGRPPHALRGKPLAEAARIVQQQIPPRASRVDRTVPTRISSIAATCLAKDRKGRFATAGDLLAAIRDALDHPATAPEGPWWRIGRPPRGRRDGFRLAAVAASAAVVGVAIALATGTIGGRGAPSPSLAAAAPAAEITYGFRSVLDADADRHLVEAVGMKKWKEQFIHPAVSYWGPPGFGVEGRLVYRIPFPGPTTRIHVKARSECWDYTREPGGVGRGASAIEVSRDGETWITVRDNITPGNWGAGWAIDDDMPATVIGGRELWLRMRFFSEGPAVRTGYAVAQFARATGEPPENVFEVRGSCAASRAP